MLRDLFPALAALCMFHRVEELGGDPPDSCDGEVALSGADRGVLHLEIAKRSVGLVQLVAGGLELLDSLAVELPVSGHSSFIPGQ